MQAIVRGFLDRVYCKKLRREAKAIRLIQRVMRGKLGRLRWKREYWKSLSIVKSESALQVTDSLHIACIILSKVVFHSKALMERSSVIREEVLKDSKAGYHWLELIDPLTDSFWSIIKFLEISLESQLFYLKIKVLQ